MSTPQQPEIARSKRSAATPESAKSRANTTPPSTSDTPGPIPEANLPGHHPETDQDKPTRRPKLPPRHHRFGFRKDNPLALAARAFGVKDDNAYVDVDDERLDIRFGPWHIETTVDNVEGVERTGPYKWWKVVGPAHLSFKDRGVTFATTSAEGVCIKFREPVAGLLPRGPLRHPAVTVTVEEPEDLVRFLAS